MGLSLRPPCDRLAASPGVPASHPMTAVLGTGPAHIQKQTDGCFVFSPTLGDKQSAYDLPVMVDDEGDGFKQNGVLGVGVLDLLGLRRFLGFIEDGL